MEIKLPKLRKKSQKKKILLISDDIRFNSGVATISRELVTGTIDRYDWVQIAAALNHPEHGQVFDLSESINRELKITDSYCKLYCHTGYGNPDVVRELIHAEKPDAIMLVTDPRFFDWFMTMEHELKVHYKIPTIWLNVWDNVGPFPFYNASAYASIDLLLAINKGTKVANAEILSNAGVETFDLDRGVGQSDGIILGYLPHGLNSDLFYKLNENSPDWTGFNEFKANLYNKNKNVEFVIFYNSRNVRRKQPGDVILAYKRFCDLLGPEEAKKCLLVMKTHLVDENGTDLIELRKIVCPEHKILFNHEDLPTNVLNWFYNIADVNIFMSSAEGFGLAANEALLSETLLLAPVTGGLQDQMRFEDEDGKWIEFDAEFTSNHRGRYKKCGPWAFPIFPRARALQGSIATPYIFDDYSDAEDAAQRLLEIHRLDPEERRQRAAAGRQWAVSEESGMSSKVMADKFKYAVDTLFERWTPKSNVEIIKVEEYKSPKNTGINW